MNAPHRPIRIKRVYEAPQVVVASGTFGKPFTPDFASELAPRIRQVHSADYRDSSSSG